jgi:hypothetical protein
MYFPAQGTLGYLHGLILYVPFYMAARAFLHPFQAYNVTLLFVLEIGILSLYFDRRTMRPYIAASSASSKLFFFPSRPLP